MHCHGLCEACREKASGLREKPGVGPLSLPCPDARLPGVPGLAPRGGLILLTDHFVSFLKVFVL